MSFSRYDEDRARTSHHTHCCIGARHATHCATGDDNTDNTTNSMKLLSYSAPLSCPLMHLPPAPTYCTCCTWAKYLYVSYLQSCKQSIKCSSKGSIFHYCWYTWMYIWKDIRIMFAKYMNVYGTVSGPHFPIIHEYVSKGITIMFP